jgi:hypothetical protein
MRVGRLGSVDGDGGHAVAPHLLVRWTLHEEDAGVTQALAEGVHSGVEARGVPRARETWGGILPMCPR